jgi:succinoglycan biosynthesis transport protein ExoP
VAERYHLLEREEQLKGLDPARAKKTLNGPIELKRLKVSRTPNTNLVQVRYGAPDPELAAAVANGVANCYLELVYRSRSQAAANRSHFMEAQLADLKTNMERSNRALAKFEKELHIVNPDSKTSILDARLLQLNAEYTTTQGERLRKEAAFNSMKSGSLEAAQVSAQGKDLLEKLSERLIVAEEIFASVKVVYGPNHPEYRKSETQVEELRRQLEDMRANIARRVETDFQQTANREEMLQHTIDKVKMESDKLTDHAQEYQQLKREAEADRTLYAELVLKTKEDSINSGVQNANARLMDIARPPAKPSSPSLKMNLALAFLLSASFAFGIAVLGGAVDDKVRDPEQTGRVLGADVIGALPLRADLPVSSKGPRNRRLIGSASSREDADLSLVQYGEAIRKLRNSIFLGSVGSELRSLLVTSAVAGEGKSMTALDLAVSGARRGKRTLLIDADLRRASVHDNASGSEAAWGLAQVLSREATWRQVIGSASNEPGLDILPPGGVRTCAADLISSGFRALLSDLSAAYDFIVVDAPPVLVFAEPLDLAAAVDGVVVIAQVGRTTHKSVATALSALNWVGANVIGIVLNRVRSAESCGHYAGYYGGRYPNSSKEIALGINHT